MTEQPHNSQRVHDAALSHVQDQHNKGIEISYEEAVEHVLEADRSLYAEYQRLHQNRSFVGGTDQILRNMANRYGIDRMELQRMMQEHEEGGI